MQNARTVQKVMDERIYRDHAEAGLAPILMAIGGAYQQARKAHCEDLVRDAVNVAKGSDKAFLALHRTFGISSTVGVPRFAQPFIDPSNKVAVGDVPDKEKETMCRLIQATVAKFVLWDRTIGNMLWLAAG